MANAVFKSLIPPAAFTFTSSPTTDFINLTSSTVAPPVPNPVDVLIKSGLTSFAISATFLFSSSVK